MGRLNLRLDEGGPKRLKIRWKNLFSQMTIELDGTLLDTVPYIRDIEGGKSYRLDDGQELRVILVEDIKDSEAHIEAYLDDELLAGSPTSKDYIFRTTGNILIVAGCFQMVIMVLAFLFLLFINEVAEDIDPVSYQTFLYPLLMSFVYDLGIAVCGYFTKRKSRAWMVLGIVLVLIRTLASFVPDASVVLDVFGMFWVYLCILLLVNFAKGFQIAKSAKRSLLPKGGHQPV